MAQEATADAVGLGEGIYVASRASRGAMWRSLRDAEGFPIISSWIDENEDGQTVDYEELWGRIADEIRESAGLVLYGEPGDFPFKGAYVEAGMALALNKRVIVCLPSVELELRTLRPLGSWLAHRKATRIDDLRSALREIAEPREKHFDQRDINAFWERNFGPAKSAARIAARMNVEMAELLTRISIDEDDNMINSAVIGDEIADVVICGMRLASFFSIDLMQAVDRKMEANFKRTWKADGTGCGQHQAWRWVNDPPSSPCEVLMVRDFGSEGMQITQGRYRPSENPIYSWISTEGITIGNAIKWMPLPEL